MFSAMTSAPVPPRRSRVRSLLLPTALLGLSALLGVAPLRAQQSPSPLNEVRALNLARNTGVAINGGLSVYRPATCMFTTSAASNPCLLRSDANGFVYRFLGGPPGWQVYNKPATRETEVRISLDGRSVVKVIYNGAPR